MLYLGGIARHIWTWSGIACPSITSIPFCLLNSRILSPNRSLISLYNFFRLYFGTQTIWYFHSHFTCDNLSYSFIIASFQTRSFRALGKKVYLLLPSKPMTNWAIFPSTKTGLIYFFRSSARDTNKGPSSSQPIASSMTGHASSTMIAPSLQPL